MVIAKGDSARVFLETPATPFAGAQGRATLRLRTLNLTTLTP